jgi:hypothetical protein
MNTWFRVQDQLLHRLFDGFVIGVTARLSIGQ